MHLQSSNLIFLAILLTYIGIRGVFAQRTKSNEKVISKVDARDRILLLAVFIGSTLLPLVYLFTRWFAFADYQLPRPALWCGIIVSLAALWLFWRSHADLGRNWSITLEMRQGHELITFGVYQVVRHPMYASIWLLSIAQGLLLQNWFAGWAALVAFAILYFVRVPREEEMMLRYFGDDYRAYAERSGRVFPRVRHNRPNHAIQRTAGRSDL
jgi:protein-S-isoprenylcysteine O-methyltransferase Ste14